MNSAVMDCSSGAIVSRDARMQADQDFLRALPPVGQTTTFRIYDIPKGYETVLPPLVHSDRF